jgi:site-specific DNA-methyltransferase (adenine-specific)
MSIDITMGETAVKPIDWIKPYWRNPRRVPEEAVNALAESISRFGYQQPIVVDDEGVIIIGHTRYKAALSLGMKTVPVVVAEGISDVQARALRIADNKLGDLSSWDTKALCEEFRLLEDSGLLDATGFDAAEISDLVKAYSGDGGDGDSQKDGARQYFYEIMFSSVEQQEAFFGVLVRLREWYPDVETIGQRLASFVDDF